MFKEILQETYKMQTSEKEIGEVIKDIYLLEHEKLSTKHSLLKSTYLAPADVISFMVLRDLKEWLFTYNQRRVNTFTFRKKLSALGKTYDLDSIDTSYTHIPTEKIDVLRMLLEAGEMVAGDAQSKEVFQRIYDQFFSESDKEATKEFEKVGGEA